MAVSARAIKLLAIFLSAIPALADQSTQDSQFRLKVLRILEKKGFVKNATCSQFSSLVLLKNGLPAIGQIEPVRGMRDNMDRRLEGREPPVFEDGNTWSHSPYYSVKVSARTATTNPSQWTLTLTRLFDNPYVPKHQASRISVSTAFSFSQSFVDNRSSCELERIVVQSSWREPLGTRSYTKSMEADDCISIFDETTRRNFENSVTDKINQFMKEDCSLGLRYYKSVKDLLARDALR
jgi:hypothetical protein